MMLGENATPDALAGLRERLGLNDRSGCSIWHWLSAARCAAISARRCAPACRSPA